MADQFTENILIPSLNVIRNDGRIKRFYFFPWLISVIFVSVLLVYQVVYTYVVLLWNEDQIFQLLLSVFHSNFITPLLIAGGIFIISYVILLPIFEGALIGYLHQSSEKTVSRSDALWFWIYRFYALFEFNNIFWMFKLASILNWFLFTLRYLGIEYVSWLAIFFFIAFLFSIILNILIAYAKYEVVLENAGVFEAIGTSSQIALLNIKTTLRLYVLMFAMNIKVIINFTVFFIFPIFAAFLTGVISSQTFTAIAFTILWVIFLFFILLLWYLAAVLDIFTTSMWYRAYKMGKEKITEIK